MYHYSVIMSMVSPQASIYRDLGTVFWGLREPIMSLSHYELGQRENNTHNRSYIGHYLSLYYYLACLPAYLAVWLSCRCSLCCMSSITNEAVFLPRKSLKTKRQFFFSSFVCFPLYVHVLAVNNSPQN